MMPKKSVLLSTAAMKGKLSYLTFSMVLLLVLSPFLEKSKIGLIISNVLLSAILIFGVYAVSNKRKNVIIATALGLPWFIMAWIDYFLPGELFLILLFFT